MKLVSKDVERKLARSEDKPINARTHACTHARTHARGQSTQERDGEGSASMVGCMPMHACNPACCVQGGLAAEINLTMQHVSKDVEGTPEHRTLMEHSMDHSMERSMEHSMDRQASWLASVQFRGA